jgi:hypothetical protein
MFVGCVVVIGLGAIMGLGAIIGLGAGTGSSLLGGITTGPADTIIGISGA